MSVNKLCSNYFKGFQEISHFKERSTGQNIVTALKIASYFTGIIPLLVAITYAISSICVKKREHVPVTDLSQIDFNRDLESIAQDLSHGDLEQLLEIRQEIPVERFQALFPEVLRNSDRFQGAIETFTERQVQSLDLNRWTIGDLNHFLGYDKRRIARFSPVQIRSLFPKIKEALCSYHDTALDSVLKHLDDDQMGELDTENWGAGQVQSISRAVLNKLKTHQINPLIDKLSDSQIERLTDQQLKGLECTEAQKIRCSRLIQDFFVKILKDDFEI